MKILVFALILAATEPTKELVSAAKEAKSKRKQPATKVLTNKDVKNSKGKLIELPAKPGPDAPAKEVDPLSPLARHDVSYRERRELDEKLSAAQAKVDKLAAELEAVELRYYEENDPNRRDTVIKQQFELVRRELLEAVAELEKLSPQEPVETPEPDKK